jgi:hypothetical protein
MTRWTTRDALTAVTEIYRETGQELPANIEGVSEPR